MSEVPCFFEVEHFIEVVHLLTPKTLSRFLLGVDLEGVDLVGS